MNHSMPDECRAVVMIPALDEIGYIEACLGSVLEAVDALENENLVQVFVTDNGSRDGTDQFVQEMSRERAFVHLVREETRGPGFARQTGVRQALARAAQRANPVHDDFWIVSTDADIIVPPNWLVAWLEVFDDHPLGVVTGKGSFPQSFAQTNPNADAVLKKVGQRIAAAEKIFGITNTDGFNFAVERKCYAIIGPFEQPHRILPHGYWENLAGEDWDFGTRARAVGMPFKRVFLNPVDVCPRRYHAAPIEYFDGTAYEKEFLRVHVKGPSKDIDVSLHEQLLEIATRKQCMYFAQKPILTDETLLGKPEVRAFLGEALADEMGRWIASTPKPNMFYARNAFHLEYLVSFHAEFSDDVYQRLVALDT
jgi:glycosyltransferase involved in cell wall biosynthesis